MKFFLFLLSMSLGIPSLFAQNETQTPPPEKTSMPSHLENVKFTICQGNYFVSNKFNLRKNPDIFLISDLTTFNSIYGIGYIMSGNLVEPKIDEAFFEKKNLLVIIEKANYVTEYKISAVLYDKKLNQFEIQGSSKKGENSGTATFQSTILIAVPKTKENINSSVTFKQLK